MKVVATAFVSIVFLHGVFAAAESTNREVDVRVTQSSLALWTGNLGIESEFEGLSEALLAATSLPPLAKERTVVVVVMPSVSATGGEVGFAIVNTNDVPCVARVVVEPEDGPAIVDRRVLFDGPQVHRFHISLPIELVSEKLRLEITKTTNRGDLFAWITDGVLEADRTIALISDLDVPRREDVSSTKVLADCAAGLTCAGGSPINLSIPAGVVRCVGANPFDNQPDTQAIQDCIDSLCTDPQNDVCEGGTVELINQPISTGGKPLPGLSGPAVYLINQIQSEYLFDVSDEWGIILRSNIRLRGELSSSPAPVLRATADLQRPLLVTKANTTNFEISDLVFDGNSSVRRANVQTLCLERIHGNLLNHVIHIHAGNSQFRITNIESINAPCGSGLRVSGSSFLLAGNTIRDIGRFDIDASGTKWIGDGITVGKCEGGQIYNNTIINATDVGIVVGGGQGCRVWMNDVIQNAEGANAGIHIGAFPNTGHGDHTGSLFCGNVVDAAPGQSGCGLGRIGIGIAAGGERWPGIVDDIFGGFVFENTVRCAGVNLGVGGYDNGCIGRGNSLLPAGEFPSISSYQCGVSSPFTITEVRMTGNNPTQFALDNLPDWDPVEMQKTDTDSNTNVPDGLYDCGFTHYATSGPVVLNPPGSVVAEEDVEVSVTMHNAAADDSWVLWKRGRGYVLAPVPGTTTSDWMRFLDGNISRIPNGVEVWPGQSHTFSFQINAPNSPGVHQLQWIMRAERPTTNPPVVYQKQFGEATAPVSINVIAKFNDAVIESYYVYTGGPAIQYFTPGQYFQARVQVRNNGNTVWTRDKEYKLKNAAASQWPEYTRAYLPQGVSVSPGETYWFYIDMEAPQEPGVYPVSWQMIEEDQPTGQRLFGQETNVIQIVVETSQSNG